MKSILAQISMIQRPGAPLCSLTRAGTLGSPARAVLALLVRTVRPQRSFLAGYIRLVFVVEAESTGPDSYPKST